MISGLGFVALAGFMVSPKTASGGSDVFSPLILSEAGSAL